MTIAYAGHANNHFAGSTNTNTVGASYVSGSTVVVVIGTNTTGLTVSTVSDGASTFTHVATVDTGVGICSVWVCLSAGTPSGLTATLSGVAGTFQLGIVDYTGVVAIGINGTATGTLTSAAISLTTQDPNNWVVAGFADTSNGSGAPTAVQGTIEVSGGLPIAIMDNTAAGAGSVTDSLSWTGGNNWAAVGVELRSTISASAALDDGSAFLPQIMQDVSLVTVF